MKQSIFTAAQGLHPKRNAFNKSYRNDYTCNIGQLVPVFQEHYVPNSTFRIRTHALIRFQALIAPVMDNIDYYVHFWQMPYRILLGQDFTKFITGEIDPADYDYKYWTPSAVLVELDDIYEGDSNKDYIISSITGNGGLFDMLGFDKSLFDTRSERELSILPFAAYVQLLMHWYINENVMPWDDFEDDVQYFIEPANYSSDLSAEIATFLAHLYDSMGKFFNHAWPKDYFTSGLPSLQFGSPTYLPLGTSAPIDFPNQVVLGAPGSFDPAKDGPIFSFANNVDGNSSIVSSASPAIAGSTKDRYLQDEDYHNTMNGILTQFKNNDARQTPLTATADLTEATAVTINELRIANALQVFKERQMRFGRRAPEYYKGFYGVRPDDLRLQLPKFLGGGRMPINISDIDQTSATNDVSPQGNLAGKGVGLAGGFASAYGFCSEETLVLGVAWLMPKVTYSNALSRHLTKMNDRYEYFNPSFEHIGEQEIHNYELYAAGNDNTFAYQPRYTEYRFHLNEQHGEFKSSLSFWTLGRLFDEQPYLNADFIYMQPASFSRIFAVQFDTHNQPVPNVLVSLKFDSKVIQPVSKYGTPSLIV